MNDWKNYRQLQEGEIVQAGDQYDKPKPGEGYGWMADTYWAEVPPEAIGRRVADPSYPAHQKFRRKIQATGEGK